MQINIKYQDFYNDKHAHKMASVASVLNKINQLKHQKEEIYKTQNNEDFHLSGEEMLSVFLEEKDAKNSILGEDTTSEKEKTPLDANVPWATLVQRSEKHTNSAFATSVGDTFRVAVQDDELLSAAISKTIFALQIQTGLHEDDIKQEIFSRLENDRTLRTHIPLAIQFLRDADASWFTECPSCGFENEVEWEYCENCGITHEDDSKQNLEFLQKRKSLLEEEIEVPLCIYCGEETDRTLDRCIHCGELQHWGET